MGRIRPVVKKEFRQIFRDKRTLGILLFVPAFMLVMFGYALSFDVKHISLAVYDADRSSMSRDFIENFLHSEYFDLNYYLSRFDDADRLLAEGKALVLLAIPEDFSENMSQRETTTIQVLVDGTNPTTASSAVSYVSTLVQDYSTLLTTEALERSGISIEALPIDFRPRVWFNPELESAKFLVPGLIGFILMVTAVVSTSLSIVREKERGTMEQITVSPLKPIELILGKTIPYVIISLAATISILVVGHLLFDVSIHGSLLLLFIVTLIFLTGCLGLGLLISTISESQQVAFMIAVIATVLPTFLLSGFVFPIRNMPVWVQVVTYLIPARYFMVALRSIILKGAGIAAFWDQVLLMIAFAVLTITISARRMRAQLAGAGQSEVQGIQRIIARISKRRE